MLLTGQQQQRRCMNVIKETFPEIHLSINVLER